MKRSEMVKVIANAVYDSTGFHCSDTQAEFILDKQERMGMLPPKRHRKMNWMKTGLTYSQWIQLDDVHEWDETEN